MSTATATKEAPKAAAARDYRVTLRHTPFRTKSRVFSVATPDEAWAQFLAVLRQENTKLTENQKKVLGRPQEEWLAELDKRPDRRPDHCEVILEPDHQRRLTESKIREEENQQLFEQSQRAVLSLAAGQRDAAGHNAELARQLVETQKQLTQVVAELAKRKG